jgi:hypothetical protein
MKIMRFIPGQNLIWTKVWRLKSPLSAKLGYLRLESLILTRHGVCLSCQDLGRATLVVTQLLPE